MKTVDKKDIQGFALKGYGKMRFTQYTLLRIEDPQLAKKWLDRICVEITNGTHYPVTTCLNLAITNTGLLALGMHPENVRNFSREFREGMGRPHTQRILCDEGASSPDNWRWGGNAKGDRRDNDNVHLMLLVFANADAVLKEFYRELEADFLNSGLSIVTNLDGLLDVDNKEHFGFRDGISQPTIAGTGDVGIKNNTVAAGEFILGYKNEYGVFPESPFVTVSQGDMNLLPDSPDGSGHKDLGTNGSYLVFRQMEQHVDRFWTFMNEKTKSPDGSLNIEESIKLASKMVGRWPSGAPLVKFPDKDPGVLSDDDDFGYAENDKAGESCPFGSHLRRNNPRDAFEDNGPKLSLKLTKKHRIHRRGRSYGEAFVGTPTNFQPKGEIGLHFMCFNTNISKQYEFIQHTWSNFNKFQNLYNDPDPITGTRENPGNELVQNFTVQGCPVSKTVTGLQQFVTIRGGAYFFFPSIAVIRYLATL